MGDPLTGLAHFQKAVIVRSIHSLWATLIFSGTAGLFLIWTLSALWHIRWVRRLPSLESFKTASPENRIKCSVVIAARDEEAH